MVEVSVFFWWFRQVHHRVLSAVMRPYEFLGGEGLESGQQSFQTGALSSFPWGGKGGFGGCESVAPGLWGVKAFEDYLQQQLGTSHVLDAHRWSHGHLESKHEPCLRQRRTRQSFLVGVSLPTAVHTLVARATGRGKSCRSLPTIAGLCYQRLVVVKEQAAIAMSCYELLANGKHMCQYASRSVRWTFLHMLGNSSLVD